MILKKKILVIVFFAISVSYSFAQTKAVVLSRLTAGPPGNIKLLADYSHERGRGIDSKVGSISKKDGLIINYDIGRMAGNVTRTEVANNKENIVWQKAQNVNNDDLLIAYFEDGKITATYYNASANFFAKTKSQEEVIDFILMIMTYGSNDEQKDIKSKK